ncbi:hypothetical protein PULV_a1699 [Pseudoalteromonas ulvae UL12]|nr:hypothetical protein [Pseudoalteromonas ulvae UL12]
MLVNVVPAARSVFIFFRCGLTLFLEGVLWELLMCNWVGVL